MRAADLRAGEHERQHVLQLVAEPVCATRLVESAPRPDPAAQRLIQQPAVDDEIEGVVWSADANGAECLVPELVSASAGRVERRDSAVALDEPAALLRVPAFAEDEAHSTRLARPELDRHVERRTRIEPGATATGQLVARGPYRPGQGAISPHEVSAIARERTRGLRRMPERHAVAELRVVRIPRDERARLLISPGHDESTFADARRSQAPLHVPVHADAPHDGRRVGQAEDRKLDRIVGWHTDGQLLLEAGRRMLVTRHARAMANHPSAALREARQWSGRGAPDGARVVVAQVDCLARSNPTPGRWRMA